MEKEKEVTRLPRTNKRISLFKKRKKPNERPLVRLKNQKNYKRLTANIIIVVVGIFILATILFIIRNIFIPTLNFNKNEIIIPQGNPYPDNNQVENVLKNSGLEISNIKFASSSSVVSFNLRKKIEVMITTEKDIRSQLDLAEAIDKQMTTDGKRAIYIDLRYNKPIVRIE